MTNRTSGSVTDAAIERMLGARAGGSLPSSVAAGIVAAIADVPQRRTGVRGFWVPRSRQSQAVLAAALIAALLLAAAIALVGTSILRQSHKLAVAPTPPPNGLVATATPSATPTATPTTGPSAPPNLAAGGPLVVYQNGKTSANIFTLDPVTGKRTALGSVQAQAPWGSVQWSADKGTVTVFRVGDGAQAIATIDVATAEMSRVDLIPGESSDDPSPSGKRIARFEGAVDVGFTLSVVDVDGTEIASVPLPKDLVAFGGTMWAPDENSILATGCRPCNLLGKGPSDVNVSHLFIVPLDGGGIRELTSSTAGGFGSPAWSRDGSRIAFSLQCDSGCDAGIGIVDVADGHVAQLTKNNADDLPTWSPDGQRIAFIRSNGNGRGLWVMDADGGKPVRLVPATADDEIRAPLWAPDGASIVYSQGALTETRMTDLWIVSSGGGDARLLLRNAAADW
jgi:Tol biopolymer transport system component